MSIKWRKINNNKTEENTLIGSPLTKRKENSSFMMNRIAVLGDSNVYRYVTADRIASKIGCGVTLMNTTRLTTLEARLKELSADDHSVILVSALGNVLSDYGRGLEVEELEDVLSKAITDFVVLVRDATVVKKKVLFTSPLFRSEPAWFADLLLFSRDKLVKECGRVSNMVVLPEFRVTGVDLLEDGVHLTPDSGSRYAEYLFSCLQDVMSSLSESVQNSSKPSTSSGLALVNNPNPTNADIMSCLHNVIMPRLDDLAGVKSKVDQLERRFLTRVASDDVEHARDREELDFLKNERMRDRVVVTGLKVDDLPTNIGDQKKFLADQLRGMIEEVVGEIVFDVYPWRNGKLESGRVPPFEVRFPSSQNCDKFKSSAYRLVKEERYAHLSTCVFSHKLTLGTRVRVEILRAISRKLTATEEAGYCPIHNPRPILQIGPIKDKKVVPSKTLTFVDAVMCYRHLISINDLSFAYKRVGEGFTGSLRRTFIVLNDEDRTQPGRMVNLGVVPSRGGHAGRGQKRKMESVRGSGGGRGGGKRSK